MVALLKLLNKAHSAQEVVQGSVVWGPTDIRGEHLGPQHNQAPPMLWARKAQATSQNHPTRDGEAAAEFWSWLGTLHCVSPQLLLLCSRQARRTGGVLAPPGTLLLLSSQLNYLHH